MYTNKQQEYINSVGGSAHQSALSIIADLEEESRRLKSAIEKTLNENAHLADGDVCTLIDLKKALLVNINEAA